MSSDPSIGKVILGLFGMGCLTTVVIENMNGPPNPQIQCLKTCENVTMGLKSHEGIHHFNECIKQCKEFSDKMQDKK